MNPVHAVQERAAQLKEILGPKITLYLVEDPTHGKIWVKDLKENSRVLARGLATFSSCDKDVGFLSIHIGRGSGTSDIVHLYRDYGEAISSLRKNVSESYKSIEEIWYTATMIPIALLFGQAWKKLG